MRERAMRDEASFLSAARKEGEHETRRVIARRLLGQPGFDDTAIARITGLPEDEVRQLRLSVGA
ncbi:MAG: hypothetical protein WCY32_04875 [Burkholderiaceae bacterium]